jgi:Bromodomain
VKNPIDLSTIREKLEEGVYTDPWQYINDVQLMFDNAWLYNRKTSKVYKACSKVSFLACYSQCYFYGLCYFLVYNYVFVLLCVLSSANLLSGQGGIHKVKLKILLYVLSICCVV